MRKFLQKFKKVFQKFADIQIKVILFLVYFLFITSFGIFIRLFKDYLEVKTEPSWQVHKEMDDVLNFLKKQ